MTNSTAKSYNMVLSQRLHHRFTPFREQASAKKRSRCLEDKVTLKLLTDMARMKKYRLFAVFIVSHKPMILFPDIRCFKFKTGKVWQGDVGGAEGCLLRN